MAVDHCGGGEREARYTYIYILHIVCVNTLCTHRFQ